MEAHMQQIAKRAGLLTLVVALYLLYVELVSFGKLRVANLDTDVIPKSSLVAAYPGMAWANTLTREWAPSNHYSYEAYVGWERKPFQGEVINIDEPGVRRTAHSHCDQPGYTIWTFGGSTIWGYGSPDVWESYQSGRGGVHQNFEDTKRLFEGHAAATAGSFQYLLDSNAGRLLWRQHQQNSIQNSPSKDVNAIAKRALRCYLENVR